MPAQLFAWFDTAPGTCALFGFSVYALFIVWRKLSARWTHWFPLAAKVTRLGLYGAAIAVLVLFIQALDAGVMSPPNLFWALGGATLAPVLNAVARQLRPREKVRRGARLGTAADVNKQAAKQLPSADFNESFALGGVKIPRSAEPYHFFVVGSTGTGKSVAITTLLDHLEARGDIALVVDSGGDFASRYYKPGRDHILNPYDDRCAPWSPTAEMAGPWDAESLAKSMIPDGVGESKEWNSYAQTFVTAVLRRLVEEKRLSIRDLLYYVQAAPLEELTPFLAGTAAAAQLVSEKTFGSIRTIATNYLATYTYLEDNPNPFSVAQFIRADKPGFLFLSYKEDMLDSLRNMIACALDVAARTILSLPPNKERRVWLVIDEFASIGKVQSIEAVATKARKVGGCLLLGLQSVSQLQDRYGDKAAQTILSCLSSWLVLRCTDADTAEYISKYIGDVELSRMTRGESSSESGGSDSLSEQIQTQRAVLPVEIQRLENLHGFFKLAGDYPLCNVKLGFPKKRDPRAATLEDRDFDAKPMLNLRGAAPVEPAAGQGGGQTLALETPTPDFVSLLGDSPLLTTAPTPAPPAAPRPAAVLKIRKSPLESGPAELESVLNELADTYENDL